MRKSIKKTIAFALTLCAISAGTIAPNAGNLPLSPKPIVAEAAETVKIGNFKFIRRSYDIASLAGYTGTASSISLPSEVTINGVKCKVTGIAGSAFKDNNRITSVKIPSGYVNISNQAFMYCQNLTYVEVPSALTTIGNYAFYGSGLRSFTIPSAVTSIGESAFSNCNNLVDVSIKTTRISKLKDNMFSNCSSLRNITLPSGITTLGTGFASCCTSLRAITLPYGLKTIGNDAFLGCTSLSSISIPSTVTTIGECAFKDTAWIKAQPKTNGLVIRNNVILDASSASGTVSIPSGITKIPNRIFQANRNITKIIMPSSVKEIGYDAFCNCTNLTEVQLSNNITEIPVNCFSDCTKLSSIYLPNAIKTIEQGAFSSCTSLKSINFPEQLKTVGFFAFNNCSSLANISSINFNNNYDINGQAFEECMNLKKLNGNTVVSRSGYNVSIYQSNFVKKYFSQTDNIGFIQDFIDKKTSAVVEQIKNQHPEYDQKDMALALEEWLCANGCNPMVKWEQTYGNKNYPGDIESRDEYHRESSVLMNGVGVCEGWAKGYYRLLKKAGITSEIAAGNNHNYNVLYLDRAWFNVDAYWDDNGNKSTHKWFLFTDAEARAMEAANNDNRGCHNKSGSLDPNYNYTSSSSYHSCINPIGDVNLDSFLTQADYNAMSNYIYNHYTSGTFSKVCADMDFDGDVDGNDLKLLKEKANLK